VKVFFTKYQEEVITVKKSVTRVTIGGGDEDFRAADFPVIEAGPGVSTVDRSVPTSPTRTRADGRRKSPDILSNRAEQVRDVVDLHRPSRNETLSGSVGYPLRGAARSRPPQGPCTGEESSRSEDGLLLERGGIDNRAEADGPGLVNKERLSRYNLTTRMSNTDQAMSQHGSHKEKKLTINVEV